MEFPFRLDGFASRLLVFAAAFIAFADGRWSSRTDLSPSRFFFVRPRTGRLSTRSAQLPLRPPNFSPGRPVIFAFGFLILAVRR